MPYLHAGFVIDVQVIFRLILIGSFFSLGRTGRRGGFGSSRSFGTVLGTRIPAASCSFIRPRFERSTQEIDRNYGLVLAFGNEFHLQP
jgi:hypothetical protein